MTKTASQLRSRFSLIIAMLVLNVIVPLSSTSWIRSGLDNYEAAEMRLQQLQRLFSAIKDGETGQRGFIITGREDYLTPLFQGYAEVDHLVIPLRQAMDAKQYPEFAALQDMIGQQRAYWNGTIQLRRERGLSEAVARVSTGEGKRLMDTIRQEVATIENRMSQESILLSQQVEWRRQIIRIALMFIAILDLVIVVIFFKFTFSVLNETKTS